VNIIGPNTVGFAIPASATLSPTFARFRISSAGGLSPTGTASDGEVEDYQVNIQPTPVTPPPVVNGDYAPITAASQSGTLVTIQTAGPHGFTAGNVVKIDGFTSGPTGLNNPSTGWTILGTPTANTFTFDPGVAIAGLPISNNTQGFAVSVATGNGLRVPSGAQRSMVDSIVYNFSVAVNLTPLDFTMSTTTPTVSGAPASAPAPEGVAPGIALYSLNGGTTWVVTWVTVTGHTITGHSVADGVYNITLTNSTRALDTFYRLYGDGGTLTGLGAGNGAVNNQDASAMNSYFVNSTYSVVYDLQANGIINNADLGPFNTQRFGSIWSGFTSTI